MARRSSTINKTRLREEIATIKSALNVLDIEVAHLDTNHNETHKKRLQSILGAGILLDIRNARKELEAALRGVKSITRRDTHVPNG